MLNGNIGVIKSMIAGVKVTSVLVSIVFDSGVSVDLTDPSNMAQGFAMMPVMWSVGGTIGCASPWSSDLW